jgi:hypothetical protein
MDNGKTPIYWMIYFEDASVRPEIFTDEIAARHRFSEALIGWSCHLFVQDSALAQAQEQMRERCAEICDERSKVRWHDDEAENEAELCAARIRAISIED